MTQAQSPPVRLQDRYQLAEWLGEGSMGIVYRAQDETLARPVAIKFLAPEKMRQSETRQRFMREARAIARLSHPNIMALYDVGEQASWTYLVLEYVPGQDLHTLLQTQKRPFAPARALTIGHDILQALAYAHDQGMIHRDIKPENILLTPDGQIKVTDFGLALAHDDVRLTQDGALVGTALYLAPELVMGQEADARSDLYALGGVLYELLTGQPPFPGDSPVVVLSKILNEPLQSPRKLNPTIPEPVTDIIMRLLAKDPNGRFSSARATLDALPRLEDDSAPIPAVTDNQSKRPSASSDTLLARMVSSSQHPAQPASEDEALAPELLVYAALEDTSTAIEQERQRLAQRLQAEIISPLTLLLSQASAYEQNLASQPTAKMALTVIGTLVRQLLQQSRDLESNLYPAVLYTLGLEPALEAFASQEIRAHGVQIELSVQRMRERLPTPVELALFRLTQELVTHSQQRHAAHIEIQLTAVAEQITYQYEDNGTLPGQLNPALLQRIEQLGGTAVVDNRTDGPLLLTVQFDHAAPVELTPRELEVLNCLVHGLSNKQIAQQLTITPRTVNFHLDNIYTKLGINSRTEAAVYALRHGWVGQ